MNEWLPLDEYRETRFLNDGRIIVVKPKNKDLIVPLFCPLCQFPLKTSDDSIAFRESNVCNQCDLHWRRPYKIKWDEGWRPQKEKIFEEYLQERELHSRPEIAFR